MTRSTFHTINAGGQRFTLSARDYRKVQDLLARNRIVPAIMTIRRAAGVDQRTARAAVFGAGHFHVPSPTCRAAVANPSRRNHLQRWLSLNLIVWSLVLVGGHWARQKAIRPADAATPTVGTEAASYQQPGPEWSDDAAKLVARTR